MICSDDLFCDTALAFHEIATRAAIIMPETFNASYVPWPEAEAGFAAEFRPMPGVAASDAGVPLVLLHGLFGEAGNWGDCAARLQQNLRVLTPDLPLFSLPFGRPLIETLSDHVLRLLDDRGISRAVVAGNSLGGHVALRLAMSHPERVEALVLTGSSGLFERGFESSVPRRPTRRYLEEKIREVFFDPAHVTESLLNAVVRTLTDTRKVLSILRLAKAAKRDNLNSLLHQIRCPTLLVWGENDIITPPSVADDFNKLISGSRLHFIPQCGHAAMMEHPAEFARILDEFLSGIRSAPPSPLLCS